MPTIGKSALSQYLRTRCDRFLHHKIHQKDAVEPWPLPLSGRPGVVAFKERGRSFEEKKYQELSDILGSNFSPLHRVSDKQDPDGDFEQRLLSATTPFFWAEAEISEKEFRQVILEELDLPVSYPAFTELRPDIIALLEPIGAFGVAPFFELLPNGVVLEVKPNDCRKLLRVIDIKATEQINTSYAAEVVLYSMVLSAWIKHRGLHTSKEDV